MGNGLYLGEVRAIKIYLHWTFLLLIGWFVLLAFRADGNINHVLYTLGYMGALFTCVVLHELGHALMARRFGIVTRDITLLPIGGVARMEKIPEDPRQEFLVAIAGPAVNICIALSLLLVHVLLGMPVSLNFGVPQIEAGAFLTHLMVVNVVMAFFNLIPAFPLDGGRILRAALASRWPRLKATQIAVRTGQIFAALFVLAGFFYSLSLLIIGIFIFLGAKREGTEEYISASLSHYALRDLAMTDFQRISGDKSLAQAITLSLKSQRKEFIVEDAEKRVIGILTPVEMLAGLTERDQNVSIAEVMRANFQVLSPDLTVLDALRTLRETNMQMLPVGTPGNIIGIIDLANIFDFLQIRQAITAQPMRRQNEKI